MDRYIAGFAGRRDRDLVICEENGVAYQSDMSEKVAYDEAYFDKCAGYEGQDIARAINAGRMALVDRFAGADASVLDIGVGSGEFIKKRANTFGFDVNPKAINWLKAEGKYSDQFSDFDAFTFWDVLEHVEVPDRYFRHMAAGSRVFTCLPVFKDLRQIRKSKHYRPGEHLYYFQERGFVDWMGMYGFKLLTRSNYESQAGRDSIVAFAFELDL